MMRLKPIRFIGHKIGPFDHIELNWDKESRHTLIVAENGMGKTTLVAAIAACLSLGHNALFMPSHLQKFAHDDEAYSYLELTWGNKKGWVFRCPLSENDNKTELQLLLATNQKSHLADGIYLDDEMSIGDGRRKPVRTIVSRSLWPIREAWNTFSDLDFLVSAYGTSRDIKKTIVNGKINLADEPLRNILDPSTPILSSEIFQWIEDQNVNYALAIAEGKSEEAEAYLAAIHRIEQLMQEDLEMPVTFQLKRNPRRLEIHQNGAVLTVDQLSDGTRSLLSWPLDYLMRASQVNWKNATDAAVAPGLILVDEIDAHLHPEWQRRVMTIVSQLLPETYIIATTHSPFVLGSVDDAQIFQIYKDGAGKLQVNSSYDELYGYPADVVLEKKFVPSLYPPEVEGKLARLGELAGKVVSGKASAQEKEEHDALLEEMKDLSPWLENLLALRGSFT
jgi:predicted ATP-binding protein involved in virulence